MKPPTLGLLIVCVAAVILSAPATGQITFEKTYGGRQADQGYSVQQRHDGGYIVAGKTESYHLVSGDVYLVKTDSLGLTVWEKTFGGDSLDCGWSVKQTHDLGYILAGFTYSTGQGLGDVYLVKTDSTGDKLWERTYGGIWVDYGFCVEQTSDTGYVISGQTMSFGEGGLDAYLIKTDSLGDTMWTRTYGDTMMDVASCVQQTLDGGYILAGSTGWTLTDSMEVYVVKTDSLGEILWETILYKAGSDAATSVRQTSDSGYVITGQTYASAVNGYDVYLIKMDSLGDTMWTISRGGPQDDIGLSVWEANDGGYVVTGRTFTSGLGDAQVHLIKTDQMGNPLWTSTYGGIYADWGYSVQQTSDSGYVVAGYTESFGAGRADVYLIKTDANGLTGTEEECSMFNVPCSVSGSMRASPNPFRTSTTIIFSLDEPVHVTLQVFDTSGRLVRTLLDRHEFAEVRSPISLQWDGADDTGRLLPSGVYFYRLTSPDFSETERATLIR